jgi:transcriptional regulator with XRE-family HTH domain
MTIEKRIKTLREKFNLSQEKLAEKVGVQRNTVWRWENSKASPMESLPALAKALSTSIAYLMGETDDPKPQSANPAPITEIVRVTEKPPPEKLEPLSAVPFAENLDLVRARGKDTSHEDRVLIAQILHRTLEELEALEPKDEAEQKFDGAKPNPG